MTKSNGSILLEKQSQLYTTLNEVNLPLEIIKTALSESFYWLTVEPQDAQIISKVTNNYFSGAAAINGNQWLESAGFLPTASDSITQITMTPLIPATNNLTIVIDPSGGAGDNQGIGPQGTTGAELNLDIGLRVATALRNHGASVHLLRSGTSMPTAEQKVLTTNKVNADLFISINRSNSFSLKHHHNSNGGELFATHYAAFASPLDSVIVTPAYDYLLRQTPCPAVIIGLPAIEDASSEIKLLDSVFAQDQASAIISAVLGFASGDNKVIDMFFPDNIPACGNADQVVVDGFFLWYPGQICGIPSLQKMHTLELHKGNQHKLIAFDKETGTSNLLFDR
ncbi:N-acetylmuramoyl-L-alanine amidase [bacterium]|nr:N-acetylmuramoyl-L-alanine amidase [bacterium]